MIADARPVSDPVPAVVGIAIIAVIFHDQRLDAGAMIGMGLIIAGIVVMRLYSTMSLE